MRNLCLVFVLALATGSISERVLVSSQSSSSTADDLYLEGRPSGDFPVDDEDGDYGSGSGSGSGDYSLSDVIERKSAIVKVLVNVSETTLDKEMSSRQTETTSIPPTTAASSQDPPTTVEDAATTPYIFPEAWDEEEEEEVPGAQPTADWFSHTTDRSYTSSSPSESTSNKVIIDIIVPEDAKDIILTEDTQNAVIVKEAGNEVLTKEGRDDALAKGGHGGKLSHVDSPEEVTSENLWERTEVLAAVIACGVVGFLCAVFLLMLLAYRMKKKDEGSYDLGDTKLSTTAYHKAPTKEFYA